MQPLDDAPTGEIHKMRNGSRNANQQNENRPEKILMNDECRKSFSSESGGALFEICVKGQLDSRWSDWLEGLEVKLLENGEMILFGPVVDQAALMGVLNKLSHLNLTLLSVNKVSRKIDKETK
jgi:hypothetical protein